MYDIDLKNVKKGKRFYLMFLVVGILFLVIFGAVVISSFVKLKSLDKEVISDRVEVNSHIDSDGTRMYSPTYYYTVDGNMYACSSNSSSNVNPGTSNKKVYYKSSSPSTCMTEYSKSSNYMFLIFLIIPIIFIVVAVLNMKKIDKRIKIIEELNQTGKLVKNLPYRLVDTGMTVNNVRIKKPVVDYTLPSGTVIQLDGDARHDRKSFDADGMVDLVIDESNPNNYFIDFEINRITGNLPTDYYNGGSTITNNQNMNQPNQYINQQSNNINFN